MEKKRIKILILIDSMNLGGAETLILQHLNHIDRDAFEVHLITQTNRGTLIPEARNRADIYVSLNRRFRLDVPAILKLRKYIVYNQIDIVHANFWNDAFYLSLATVGLTVKKIATIHGFNPTWRWNIHLQSIRHFDRIVCVSKTHKIFIYEFGFPWDQLSVVYNCFDTERFHPIPALESRECRESEPFRIVMVGSFNWGKDQKTIIDAVRILDSKGYSIELHLVGKGSLTKGHPQNTFEENQKRVKSDGLEHIVRFWEEKRVDASFLSRFDLFVFSTLSDTFGIAMLEAMACGIPVLAADCPPLRTRMGRKGRERSLAFTPQKVVKDLEKLYREVL